MLRALTWPPVSHPEPRTSCAALVQCRDLSGPRPPLRNGVRVALTSGRANTQRGQRGSAGQGPLCPLCPSAPGACHALVGRSWGACSLVREDRGLAMATKQQARGRVPCRTEKLRLSPTKAAAQSLPRVTRAPPHILVALGHLQERPAGRKARGSPRAAAHLPAGGQGAPAARRLRRGHSCTCKGGVVGKRDAKTLIWTPTCRRRQSSLTPKTAARPPAPLGASVGELWSRCHWLSGCH